MTPTRTLARDLVVFAAVAGLTWAVATGGATAVATEGRGDVATEGRSDVAAEGSPGARTVTADPVVESWYSAAGPTGVADPTCASPLGCVLAGNQVADYPDGTLHVGTSGGAEQARTYLQLDLAAVPDAATPTGGTLVVPIGPPADGSATPDAAQVVACLVRGELPDGAAGDPVEQAPDVDCTTSSPAALDAGATTLTVDLAPFAAAWTTHGAATLALVPDPASVEAGDGWHVAVSRTDRPDPPTPPASARLTLADADDETTDPTGGSTTGGSTTGGTAGPARSAPSTSAGGGTTSGTGGSRAPSSPGSTTSGGAATPITPAEVQPPGTSGSGAEDADDAVAMLTPQDDVPAQSAPPTVPPDPPPAAGAAAVPLVSGLLAVVAVRSLTTPMTTTTATGQAPDDLDGWDDDVEEAF